MEDLSETDKKILKGLKENSRIPFTQLADRIGIPDTTLHFHVKKMKKKGIIKRFTIIVGSKNEKKSILIKIKIGGHIIPEASVDKARTLGNSLKDKFNFVAISDDKVTIYGIVLIKNEDELNDLLNTLKRDPDIIDIEYKELNVLKGKDFLNIESI
ncbi:MAG: winged helix-turn-helix transcriptional regulator [Candidatus Lokiarchaeota archaeon]|nr:winged helix-turn-helix transcriptional regulator [Candidatus Lokiarchaeota archaeon]